ncbi:hypothetical protein CHCC15337_3516 [Bacillus paralicheniformis]|nr:hypothetical protein CHCC5021_3077 [Bacillus paralicheniformis]TWL11152.1 hypothetical protein CHCC19468_1986 [Bacillus paralicheniformis]TWL45707.1 hypothetical protein CHCC15337_3516 [Bacillus paralicheniformis]TWL58441.1 hypothetical protein CHCC15332_1219 [Bacillus paralicheniformis]TWM30786.1 hypothetical protein CHCC14821_0511 [Bacillus paralicheniformis]
MYAEMNNEEKETCPIYFSLVFFYDINVLTTLFQKGEREK